MALQNWSSLAMTVVNYVKTTANCKLLEADSRWTTSCAVPLIPSWSLPHHVTPLPYILARTSTYFQHTSLCHIGKWWYSYYFCHTLIFFRRTSIPLPFETAKSWFKPHAQVHTGMPHFQHTSLCHIGKWWYSYYFCHTLISFRRTSIPLPFETVKSWFKPHIFHDPDLLPGTIGKLLCNNITDCV